jgi:adenylate cyclase
MIPACNLQRSKATQPNVDGMRKRQVPRDEAGSDHSLLLSIEELVNETSRLLSLISRLVRIGTLPGDFEEDHLRKSTLVGGSLFIMLIAPVWIGTYAAHSEWLAAAIPLSYEVLTVASLTYFARTRKFRTFYLTAFTLMLILPMLLQWSLGGFVASSGVVLWSFVTPVAALLIVGPRRSVPWFIAFVGVVVVSALIDPLLSRSPAELPASFRYIFFAVNFTAVTTTSFVIMRYFVQGREAARRALDLKHLELIAEQERSERLLLNVLPQPIANRLKSGESPIADRVPDVAVLFADIVGFTSVASRMSPADLVSMLNELFSTMDRSVNVLGLEKIKTIGDSYMLVGGLTRQRTDHLEAVAEMALTMPEIAASCSRQFGEILTLRIGVDVGPVVAGVIGQQRFGYDLWGDTVNTASRMASYGVPGQIQVTARVAQRLSSQYQFETRGLIEIKGKGAMQVYLLKGKYYAPSTLPATRFPHPMIDNN